MALFKQFPPSNLDREDDADKNNKSKLKRTMPGLLVLIIGPLCI